MLKLCDRVYILVGISKSSLILYPLLAVYASISSLYCIAGGKKRDVAHEGWIQLDTRARPMQLLPS